MTGLDSHDVVVDALVGQLPDPDAAACRVCGCTEDAACPGGCWWVPDPELAGELCSVCVVDLVHAFELGRAGCCEVCGLPMPTDAHRAARTAARMAHLRTLLSDADWAIVQAGERGNDRG
jgi:hypothetical protein